MVILPPVCQIATWLLHSLPTLPLGMLSDVAAQYSKCAVPHIIDTFLNMRPGFPSLSFNVHYRATSSDSMLGVFSLMTELVKYDLLFILTFTTVSFEPGLNSNNSYRPLSLRFLPMLSFEAISNSSGPPCMPVTVRYTLAISNLSLSLISQVIIKSCPCRSFVSLNLSSATEPLDLASTHTEMKKKKENRI